MRRKAKIDVNHRDVVDAFRRCGWRVLSLAQLGGGVPDLLVQSPRGEQQLVEVKDRRGLWTPEQVRLQADGWRVMLVRSVEDVLVIVKAAA